MATQTPNLGLTKPEATDEILATIAALAANMDTIDGIVGEVGSNENGSYARFANGLQVCWKNHQTPASVEVNVANSGWGYRSAQQSAPFPASFIDSVRTFAVANINTVGYFATSGASSAVSFTFHFVSGASVTVPSGAFVNLLAIGRWK